MWFPTLLMTLWVFAFPLMSALWRLAWSKDINLTFTKFQKMKRWKANIYLKLPEAKKTVPLHDQVISAQLLVWLGSYCRLLSFCASNDAHWHYLSHYTMLISQWMMPINTCMMSFSQGTECLSDWIKPNCVNRLLSKSADRLWSIWRDILCSSSLCVSMRECLWECVPCLRVLAGNWS